MMGWEPETWTGKGPGLIQVCALPLLHHDNL
jgi:hypothetical protein